MDSVFGVTYSCYISIRCYLFETCSRIYLWNIRDRSGPFCNLDIYKVRKKTFAEYNLVWKKNTPLKFLQGLAIGVTSYALITLILIVFAELKIQKIQETINPWIWFSYLAILPASLMEEIAFRSYPFLKLNKAFGLEVNSINSFNCFRLRAYSSRMEYPGGFPRSRNMGINIRDSSSQVQRHCPSDRDPCRAKSSSINDRREQRRC